jgi:hypothetical protein
MNNSLPVKNQHPFRRAAVWLLLTLITTAAVIVALSAGIRFLVEKELTGFLAYRLFYFFLPFTYSAFSNVLAAQIISAVLAVLIPLGLLALIALKIFRRDKGPVLLLGSLVFIVLTAGLFFGTRNTFFFHSVDKPEYLPAVYYIETNAGYEFYSRVYGPLDEKFKARYSLVNQEIIKNYLNWLKTGKMPPAPELLNDNYVSSVGGDPVAWYDKVNGEYIIFTLPGINPATCDTLKPMSEEVVKKMNEANNKTLIVGLVINKTPTFKRDGAQLILADSLPAGASVKILNPKSKGVDYLGEKLIPAKGLDECRTGADTIFINPRALVWGKDENYAMGEHLVVYADQAIYFISYRPNDLISLKLPTQKTLSFSGVIFGNLSWNDQEITTPKCIKYQCVPFHSVNTNPYSYVNNQRSSAIFLFQTTGKVVKITVQ